MNDVVRTRGLTRRFGTVTAVDGVDLALEPGQVYGFLGRNGAGKSTLIRMLLGLLPPTSGEAALFGHAIRGAATPGHVWARVGYLIEGPGLYPALTVHDHLSAAARLRGLPAGAVADTAGRLGLEPYLRVRARALSLGNRQRLGLALALIHRPGLLILDEPGNGLDPAANARLRTLIRELADEGTAVFMSSHLIDEIARTADRVGVIHHGRLIEELSATDLAAALHERLVIAFRDTATAVLAATALDRGGIHVERDRETLTTRSERALTAPEDVAALLVAAGTPPRHLAAETDDLEAHFLRVSEDDR